MTGITVHASCVAIGGRGVLLIGPPASGKSDLALRLIDASGRATGSEAVESVLVSDDYTQIAKEGDRLIASPPPALAGFLEVRGLGIVKSRYLASCELFLAVQLSPSAAIERMPDPQFGVHELAGGSLPLVAVDPASASAPARIRAALLVLALA